MHIGLPLGATETVVLTTSAQVGAATSEEAFPWQNRRLALATLALVVSAVPAKAQNVSAPPDSSGYYRNSLGRDVPRPCGDWHHQPPPSGATARCRDGTYSYIEHLTTTVSTAICDDLPSTSYPQE
jgi:uncharacterized protein DUF3761